MHNLSLDDKCTMCYKWHSLYYLIASVFCLSLSKVDAFPMTVMFGMCSIFLFVAAVLQRRLMMIAESQKPSMFSNFYQKYMVLSLEGAKK